jgi:hypothetical protein
MSHIINPIAYWNNAHKSDANKPLNVEFEYFISNSNLKEKRIYNLVESINKYTKNFDYVTNYEPYKKLLEKLQNIIIDYANQKIILIPSFFSSNEATNFKDKNYNEFRVYIQRVFNKIPSNEFLQFINSQKYTVDYIINNFNDSIVRCENKYSIKFIVSMIDSKISYVKNEKPIQQSILQPIQQSILPSVLSSDPLKKYVPPHLRKNEDTFNDIPDSLISDFIRDDIENGFILKESTSKSNTSLVNFNEETHNILRKYIMNQLSVKPSDEKLEWLNNLYDSIIHHQEFIDKISNSSFLKFDLISNKIIRKRFILNPEEEDY